MKNSKGQFSKGANPNKTKHTVVSAGVPPGAIKLPKEETPTKKLTYDEQLAIFEAQGVKPPQSCLIIVAPIFEKKTAGGIYIPETVMNDDQKMAAFLRWHRVLAVSSNIPDVKVGDEVWVNSQKAGSAVGRVVIDDYSYIKIDYYVIDGIRPYKESNYETNVDNKEED